MRRTPRYRRAPVAQTGDSLPETPLTRIRGGLETVDTRTLFDGKKVVLFAVPGAFTPTCS